MEIETFSPIINVKFFLLAIAGVLIFARQAAGPDTLSDGITRDKLII